MKSVHFIRHAKSSWDQLTLSDHDRPLNERGIADAPKMAAYLREKEPGLRPCILSSTAKRAWTTAEYFIEKFNVPSGSVIKSSNLYHCSIYDIEDELTTMDDFYDHILLFSHNPTMSEILGLVSNGEMFHLPTCGILACSVKGISKWSDFTLTDLKYNYHAFPKLI